MKRQARKGQTQSGPAAALLAWYDANARVLPWRRPPRSFRPADPYAVWLSEIMLQQTTVAAVIPYYLRFRARFPSVAALAAADLDDVLSYWAGLGYYMRARKLHECARLLVARYGGDLPDTEDELLALPGIGPYTAAAIAAIAFDRKAAPVDGNIERVIARLHAIEEPLPAAKAAIRARAAALVPERRSGDFAQAMMDLGSAICSPKTPSCHICPLTDYCAARRLKIAESLPRRAPKPERPLRIGAAFVLRRHDGAVLLRRRPEMGLLGGMLEVPSTPWRAPGKAPDPLGEAPIEGEFGRLEGRVVHVFTHFRLELDVYSGVIRKRMKEIDGAIWARPEEFGQLALPSVMKKVLAKAGLSPARARLRPRS